MNEKALIIDEDFLMRGFAVESLRVQEIEVIEASTLEEARRLACSEDFDFIFADMKVLNEAGRRYLRGSPALVVVMASFSQIEKAISMVQDGASYDYLTKPFSTDQVTLVISRAREVRHLRDRVHSLEKMVESGFMNSEAPVSATSSAGGCQVSETNSCNLQDLERETILRVYDETGGRRAVMADKLGISVRTLRNKLTQYRQEDEMLMH